MKKVREKFKNNDITMAEYRVEAVMSTIEFLEDHYKYQFIKAVGSGSFGAVVEIMQPNKQRRVAAKIVLEEFTTEAETKIWPFLSHENILPLINVEHIASTYSYIFLMPLYPSSLGDIVEGPDIEKDVNGIEKAVSWFHGICNGVHYLHEEGLCHLDLKLSNVLISDNGQALLCDFGSLTRTEGATNNYLSPYFYQPPEALETKDGQKASVNGYLYDIYTLGLLCLELFTKESLCRSKNVQNTTKPSWTEILYPTIFNILEKKTFEYLAKSVFLMSAVRRETLCHIRDIIRGCININPFKRPTSTDLLQHKIFNGDKDFKEIKNDVWIVKCNAEEIKFLLNYYIRQSVEKNVPLKAVQNMLQTPDKPEKDTVEKDLVKAENEARLEELELARLDSSCKGDEQQFVKLETRKSKKCSFKEWMDKKKTELSKVFHRLCCCCRRKTTVNST